MRLNHAKDEAGFTLIEILIVIAIGTMLTTIVLSSARGAQKKAAASRIVSSFQLVEKGLLAYAIEDSTKDWWDEDYFRSFGTTSSVNMRIDELIVNLPELASFIPDPPTKPLDDRPIYYDSDSDTGGECGSNANGVNLIFYTSDLDLVVQADKTLDINNDPNCGTIRYWQSPSGSYTILYKITPDYQTLTAEF